MVRTQSTPGGQCLGSHAGLCNGDVAIRRLRAERDELRRHLQGALGKQLTNLSTAPLLDRIATLSQELTQARQADQYDHVNDLRDDLDAARRALRQMIKNNAADAAEP